MRTIYSILLLTTILILHFPVVASKPKVFIFTDINIEAGDPDDRQSLVHLFWYADELDILGIVPDRVQAQGVEACELALAAYKKDYDKYNFATKGFPTPNKLKKTIVWERSDIVAKLRQSAKGKDPLYVLVWGNMRQAGAVLQECKNLLSNIRVITIGTGLMLDRDRKEAKNYMELKPPAVQLNWNGPGRNEIYNNPDFHDLWWLEINWTYNGMFTKPGPRDMFKKLQTYGSLGMHMEEVTKNNDWARYFRVGDTPTVLYVIDPSHNQDDPTESSWAGAFRKPFPKTRPNYYTDDCGPVAWNYANPAKTWDNQTEMFEHCRGTLEKERAGMYVALLGKLDRLYRNN